MLRGVLAGLKNTFSADFFCFKFSTYILNDEKAQLYAYRCNFRHLPITHLSWRQNNLRIETFKTSDIPNLSV